MTKGIFIYLLITIMCGSIYATPVRLYPAIPSVISAKDYKVWVNGKQSVVYDLPCGAYTLFEAEDSVEIVVQTVYDIKRTDIRPQRLKCTAERTDQHSVRFCLAPNSSISVEFNNNLKRPLFIFASLPDKSVPDRNDPDVIYFSGGSKYDAGTIKLEHDQTVYIEGGAMVKARIISEGSNGIAIRGRGILDGTLVRGEEDYRTAVINYRTWPRLIEFKNCCDISIEGITLVNSNTWNIVPELCKNVQIENIKILCDNPSDDGIDIIRSMNIKLKNCFIRTKDDCIAVKSLFHNTSDTSICGDILIEKCTLWSAEWGNCVEIGFETLVPVIENITVKDCDIIHEEGGAVFSIHNTDYAAIRKINYEEIRIEDARDKLIDLGIFVSLFSIENPFPYEEFIRNHYSPGPWSNALKITPSEADMYEKSRGTISNITFKGLQLAGNIPYSVLSGYSQEHDIRNVTFEDIIFCGTPLRTISDLRVIPDHVTGLVFR